MYLSMTQYKNTPIVCLWLCVCDYMHLPVQGHTSWQIADDKGPTHTPTEDWKRVSHAGQKLHKMNTNSVLIWKSRLIDLLYIESEVG